MVAETFHADVATISLQWLMLARDAARNEPMMAAMFFGLDAAQTEMLARADLRKIQELANSGIVSFRPTFSVADLAAAPPASRRPHLEVVTGRNNTPAAASAVG
ncbi:MAG: hypothetical protein L6Q73_20640 [Aquabacterium sp.]|jgi:hypothetical protein|nr:hypothetical protein [Aquabacterium sp.]